MLAPAHETGAALLCHQADAPLYHRLDHARTVRQSLAAKTVIEFPTLLVVKAAELPRYAVVKPAQPPRPPADPHPAVPRMHHSNSAQQQADPQPAGTCPGDSQAALPQPGIDGAHMGRIAE